MFLYHNSFLEAYDRLAGDLDDEVNVSGSISSTAS